MKPIALFSQKKVLKSEKNLELERKPKIEIVKYRKKIRARVIYVLPINPLNYKMLWLNDYNDYHDFRFILFLLCVYIGVCSHAYTHVC